MEEHNNIKELREQMLMTQKELVEKVNIPGFDVSLLSKIENGRCRLTAETEKALCAGLQATVDELYGEWREIALFGVGAHTAPWEAVPEADWQVKELIACLRTGKRNAKGRRALAAEMGLRDRELRRVIARAQEFGFWVCNNSDGFGYYLAADAAEKKAFYRQELARAKSSMKKLMPLKARLKEEGIYNV